jgi:asparagine synthase (glutamine-hydrolysing)
MLRSIYHRGPDEDGRLIDGPLAMGMRRLSIIDLADGTQPIFDESGRYGVVSNGEIYNYRELREQLLSRGHQLKTHSDTETIVHLFEEHREKCLEHLRGMFALAVWDSQRRELFLARDRMGIKPLYYTLVDGELIFASEIKAILQHPAVKREVDTVAMSQYLSLKYVPAPRTLFKNIQSLPPGHWLKADATGKVEIERYWDISFAKPQEVVDEREQTDRLLALLRETNGIHLRSDVPFGAFLSGGLDSSTIVALIAEQLSSPVKTFSVGFSDPGLQDESPYAQQVADAFGCEHQTLKISSNDFLSLADNVLFHLDQPFADQATIATYMVAKLARQQVKMVLKGEGGDELFAGYARYAGEFAAGLPGSLKLKGSQSKYLLRQVARRLLPRNIIERKKQGFPIPIQRWLKNEAAPLMQDVLSEGRIKQRGYFRWDFVERMMKEHRSGYANHSAELWGLISLEMWMQQFIDATVAPLPTELRLPALPFGNNSAQSLTGGCL